MTPVVRVCGEDFVPAEMTASILLISRLRDDHSACASATCPPIKHLSFEQTIIYAVSLASTKTSRSISIKRGRRIKRLSGTATVRYRFYQPLHQVKALDTSYIHLTHWS